MKHKARQFEMSWSESEGFALIPERGTDWAKVQEEQKRKALAKKESENRNLELFGGEL